MTQAVIDDYNDRQLGPYVELQVLDVAQTAAELQADSAGALALLSCAGVTACQQQAQVAKANAMPLLGVMASASSLASDGVFVVRPGNAEVLQSALQGIAGMRVKKVAVLVQNNAQGKRWADDLQTQTLPDGMSLGEQVAVDAKTNFGQVAQRLQASGATGVLLLSEDLATAQALMKSWHKPKKSAQSYLPIVMHLPALARPDYAGKAVGYPGGALFVTVVPSPWGGRTQAQREYQSLAQSRGIYRANYESFEAYLNAKVALQAIAQGKVKSAAQMQQYLRGSSFALGGVSLRFEQGQSRTKGFLDQAVLGADGSFRH